MDCVHFGQCFERARKRQVEVYSIKARRRVSISLNMDVLLDELVPDLGSKNDNSLITVLAPESTH